MMDLQKLCETYDTLYSKLSAELQKNGYDCPIVDELSEGIIGKLNNKIDDTYLPFLEYITQTNRPYHDAFTSSNLLRLLQSSNTAFGLTCGVEAPLALMSIYLVDGTLTVATYYFARSSEEAEDDSMCDSGYKIGIQCVQGAVSTVTERIGSKSAYQPTGSSVRNSIAGKTIVVTGDLVNFPEPGPYPQRVAFRKFVESHGGKLTSSISGKTSYLVCNDQSSGTTKVQQAKEKGTPILTEKEFLEMVGVAPTPAPAVVPWDFKIQNGVLTKYRGHDRMVVIPGCVTTIGEYAFNSIAALQSVVIPNSVTTLDYCAFCGCTNLQSITIPDSVTTIGSAAFVGCTGLRSITIPDSVTTIDWDAFEGCTGLQSITIPNSVTTIGRRAFEGCTGLQSITIPNSITTIDKFVFDGCTNLQSITIPNSVTTIGEHAFRDCKCLQSVTIPDSVTTIDRGAFEGCSSLQSITIPNSVTTIGWWAFEGCSSLQSITIPDSVTTIGSGAFSLCKNLACILVDTKNPNFCNDEYGVVFNKDMTSLIAAPAGIEKYVIPQCTTTINGWAFFGCKGLRSITLPDSVTIIGRSAFSGCKGLRSITIPDSVTTIDGDAFSDCKGLRSITIPDSVTTIDWDAFEGCSSLQSITIPDSVTIIGVGAFSGCKRLRSVAIPNSVTTLGGHAFFNCTHLETITIPEGITAIKAGTFKHCAKLKFVFLPTSVATIDQEAFQECDNLQFIFAPGVPFGDFTETKFKILAAIGYMQNCGAYKDTDNKALYEKYISSQKKRMLVVIFQHDIVQAVEYLEKVGKITHRNYEKDFLIPAQQAGATQCVDFLLKWKASMA